MILFWNLEAGEILQLAQNAGPGIHTSFSIKVTLHPTNTFN